MRIAKFAVASLTIAGVAVQPSLCVGQAPPAPWPAEQLQAAIAGCRAAIIDQVTRDYLSRAHLTADQLPPDFSKLFERPEIAPILRVCDCSFGILSKEIPFDKFQPGSPQVGQRLKDLASPGGACAPGTGT